MNQPQFLEKVRNFSLYTENYQTITLYELRSLFGSSLFACLIALLTLPLFLFSTQWVVLPCSTFLIFCAIWQFFEVKVWMPDWIKRLSFSQKTAKKIAQQLEYFAAKRHTPYWPFLCKANSIAIALAAFLVGFVESPASSSFFSLLSTLLSILVLAIASFFEKENFSIIGYLLLMIAFIFSS